MQICKHSWRPSEGKIVSSPTQSQMARGAETAALEIKCKQGSSPLHPSQDAEAKGAFLICCLTSTAELLTWRLLRKWGRRGWKQERLLNSKPETLKSVKSWKHSFRAFLIYLSMSSFIYLFKAQTREKNSLWLIWRYRQQEAPCLRRVQRFLKFEFSSHAWILTAGIAHFVVAVAAILASGPWSTQF